MRAYFRNIYAAVSTILIGMRITFKEMFHPSVTNQYPYQYYFEKRKNVRGIHKGFRGQLYIRMEDCIGCKKCAMICPVDCIYIETSRLEKGITLSDTRAVVRLKDQTVWIGELLEGDEKIEPGTVVKLRDLDGNLHESPSEHVEHVVTSKKRRLKLDRFDIDMSLCMFCGLCTEVCSTSCLYMTQTHEFSTYDRASLLFHFADPSIYEGLTPDETETKAEDGADASEGRKQKAARRRQREETA